MSHELIRNFDDCTEFRQTLAARPPAILHGAALLLVLLVVATGLWAALVEANIVVKATGRVRPVVQPARVFAEIGEHVDGRVSQALVSEGDQVVSGQVLLRLDTQRLQNLIVKVERQISSVEEELHELDRIDLLVIRQFESAAAKASAELLRAKSTLKRDVRRRESEIGEAEAELAAARDVFDRNRHLAASRAISRAELVESKSKAEMAQARMKQSRLPIDDGEIAILRHALTAVEREYAVRRAELDAKRVVKRGDAARLRKELANLELAQTRSVVRAPVDGIVVTGQIKPGDVIERGKPVYEIASQRGFHFEAAVPSEDIGQLEVGMQANVKFDAYDYQKFGTLAATVCFVSPDSSVAEGTEQSSGGASYLVRLKLHGDVVGRDGQLRGRVKLGLGGNAEIVADRETILMILLRNLRGTISLG